MRGGFAPGDVARVVRNGREVVATRYDTGVECGWRWQQAKGVAFDHFDADPGTTPRPLVVIDPEDREQVERLTRAHRDYFEHLSTGVQPEEVDAMQSALRSLVPRPPEPLTLGAVVEDAAGQLWTRVERGEAITRNPWYPAADAEMQPAEYVDITAVRVLSEGVTE